MISTFFIKRPIFATVISIVIVLVGVLTFPLLPIEKTPNITPPTVVVSARYPGLLRGHSNPESQAMVQEK